MRGTHRSLLQTGGRKEARFSSTQVFTLTGRSMVAREPALEPDALAGVEGVRLRPAAHWPPSESATLGGGKGRGNAPRPPAASSRPLPPPATPCRPHGWAVGWAADLEVALPGLWSRAAPEQQGGLRAQEAGGRMGAPLLSAGFGLSAPARAGAPRKRAWSPVPRLCALHPR